MPSYARDVTHYVEDNQTLRKINRDYDITDKLEEEAGKLPNRLGGAAGTLRDVGFGIVNSLFALITILVLTAFLLGNGGTWVDASSRRDHPSSATGCAARSTTWPTAWPGTSPARCSSR